MQSVNEYLETVSQEQLTEYNRVRNIVYKIVPEASETMAYGIPTFKYKDKNLIHFGAFKDHVSIFPGANAIELLREKLSSYKLSKGTIQYSTTAPIPEVLILALLKICISEIDT